MEMASISVYFPMSGHTMIENQRIDNEICGRTEGYQKLWTRNEQVIEKDEGGCVDTYASH